MTINFVPVAVNLYKVRAAKDAGGELFRSVQRQKDQYQGIWIISSDGKVLAGHHTFKSQETWSKELLETVDAALKAFGPVSPRSPPLGNPLPDRGQGEQTDGSVSLALYARQMRGGGRQSAPAGVAPSRLWLWDGELRPDGPVVIDTLTLTAKEWAALTPPKAEIATTWTVPETLARRFCRVLIPSSDQSTMPRPQDARRVELRGTVESIEDGSVRIRFTGIWEAVHLQEGDSKRPLRGAATAEGLAVYDLKHGAMESLLLVFSGSHGRPNDEAVAATGAVVEWRLQRLSQ